MTQKRVEWVLVVHYGKSAHRATYGRLPGQTYTKDYIQLSRKPDFISDLEAAFPEISGGKQSIPIEFEWPAGTADGKLFRRSADRPHLAWETNSAPPPWKMSPHPSAKTAETILGDPTKTSSAQADIEFEKLLASEFGQPFLIAVKLDGEPQKLHLRVLIETPTPEFRWAALDLAPQLIQKLAEKTSKTSALAWKLLNADGEEANLYFDPSKKAGPWTYEPPTATTIAAETSPIDLTDEPINDATDLPSEVDSDTLADALPFSEEEVSAFVEQVQSGSYAVASSTATVKTRGSAQKAFADIVKKNYGNACALTGIKSREFLIASHIVPWSEDETIRLDPSNGICLSVLVDRAFESGFLVISDDLVATVDWEKVGTDSSLGDALQSLDGIKLSEPKAHSPRVEYLQRRRGLIS